MSASLLTVFTFVLLAGVQLSSAATDYCSLCTNHIACNNNGAFASTCESNAQVIPVTSALKTAILKKHNTLRNIVASGGLSGFKPAARMATMQWSTELESLALLNVKQCQMKHDACRATSDFPYAGQNLAYTAWMGMTKTVDEVMDGHIQSWYNENKDATMSQMDSYKSNGKVVGHFTQMMLEKATHVGCSIIRQVKDGFTYQYSACNYAFITFVNRPVYTSATTAASQCKSGNNPSFKALCSTNESYDVKKP